jgi:hypothetical protein
MLQSAVPMLGARRDQMFPTMTQADIDRLYRFGESKFFETGERIVRAGPGLAGASTVLFPIVMIVFSLCFMGISPIQTNVIEFRDSNDDNPQPSGALQRCAPVIPRIRNVQNSRLR